MSCFRIIFSLKVCRQFTAAIAALLLATVSSGAAAASDFGYPSVDAALAALKAKSGTKVSDAGGWTIVNDPAGLSIYSFTPPSHPAHPAGVKRSTAKDTQGNVYIEMAVLCQATKSACDQLVAEFKQLNENVKQQVAKASGAAAPSTSASATEDAKEMQVRERTVEYFRLRDSRKYPEAFAMQAPSRQMLLPIENWKGNIVMFLEIAGTPLSRKIHKVTWYMDPPGVDPGLYAAVDHSGTYDKVPVHCGFVAWRFPSDGAPLIVREEENFIDAETIKRIPAAEVDAFKKRYRCAG